MAERAFNIATRSACQLLRRRGSVSDRGQWNIQSGATQTIQENGMLHLASLQPLGNPTPVESNSQFPTSVHTRIWFLNRLEPVSLKAQGEGNVTAVAILQGTTMAERAFNIDRNAISLPAATAERKRCGVCWGPVENSVWRDPNDPRGSQPVPVPADNTRMECFTWPACGTALQTLVNSTHVESNSQFPTSVHTLRGSKPGSAVVVYLLWFLNRCRCKAQGEGNMTALAVLEGTIMVERAFNIATRSACQLLRRRGSVSDRGQWKIQSGATQTIQEKSAVVVHLVWFLNRLEPASRKAQGEGNMTFLAVSQRGQLASCYGGEEACLIGASGISNLARPKQYRKMECFTWPACSRLEIPHLLSQTANFLQVFTPAFGS